MIASPVGSSWDSSARLHNHRGAFVVPRCCVNSGYRTHLTTNSSPDRLCKLLVPLCKSLNIWFVNKRIRDRIRDEKMWHLNTIFAAYMWSLTKNMKGTSPTLLSIPFSLHICQPWNMIIDYCIFASPYSPSASFFFSFFYFLCAFLLPASATVLSIGEVVVLGLSWQEVRTGQCVCRLIIDWRRLIRCYWSARAFELSTNKIQEAWAKV